MSSDKNSGEVPCRVIDLGGRNERYDFSKLPRKKRKSSSYVQKTSSGCSRKGDTVVGVPPGLPTALQPEEANVPSVAGSSTAIVHKANVLEAYMVELATARGFVLLDSSLTTAAVQDFDDENFVLKVRIVAQ